MGSRIDDPTFPRFSGGGGPEEHPSSTRRLGADAASPTKADTLALHVALELGLGPALAVSGMPQMRDLRVPVTILSGFLGSGRRLFNHILTASRGKKIAVIQNEFGEVGIDDALMAANTKFASEQEIVEVLNGCVLLGRSDLVNVLKKLAERSAGGRSSSTAS